MFNFIKADREQPYLLPPSLQEWLPADHLSWFVLDAVDQMDLGGFYRRYRSDGHGGAAFEPSMMVSLLLYAYCVGERSSRRIERLCETDIAFRVIVANRKPDHATVARFRRTNWKELKNLFVQILRLCREAGLASLGTVGLDGTKLRANASLNANRTHDGLDAEVERLLNEAEAKDGEEDAVHGKRRGDELPEALRGKESRLARLKECRERLEREAKEKADERKRKIQEREAKEKASGLKKRGKKPALPNSNPSPEAKANVTDPESRVMKTKSGYVQAYNAQAAINEKQIVLSAEVTQEANDRQQLKPIMKSVRENAAAAGIKCAIDKALADSGYWSDENAKPDGRVKTEYFIATTKAWKLQQAQEKMPLPRGRIPSAATLREKMERKLRTKRGREIYRMRSVITEPVFGQIKDARGIDRFLLRGRMGADLEWKLICGTSNLLKLWRAWRIKIQLSSLQTALRRLQEAVSSIFDFCESRGHLPPSATEPIFAF